jgi:hypothetical protein
MPKRNKKVSRPRAKGNNLFKDRLSIDLDKQNARLKQTSPDSLTWNVVDESIPRFGRSSRFDNNIFNIVQTTNIGTVLTSSATLPVFGSLYFTANAHISQFSSFSAVFDQYRIMEIEVWLQPTTSAATSLGSNTSTFCSVIDYDDSNTPLTMSSLYQYENTILGNTANGHYRKFRPHIATAAYTGSFSGYENQKSQWIDVASSTVQHYGVKMGIDVSNNVSVLVQCFARLWVQFRNVF